MSLHRDAEAITLSHLRRMKSQGEKIVCLTAYDASFAALSALAGVEVVLIGDTLGMVIQGHTSTVPVTVDDVIYHSRCVARGCHTPMVMADMPFLSYREPRQALSSAARLMQEGGARIVKLEGGEHQVDIVAQLGIHGIPVCAHMGLQPQAVHKLGGFRVHGRDAGEARRMFDTAQALQEAGAELLLLECVPAALAAEITANVGIPVIGIGAGAGCDGQILVLHDILGITGQTLKFTHDFMAEAASIEAAIKDYVRAVKEKTFPSPAHSF